MVRPSVRSPEGESRQDTPLARAQALVRRAFGEDGRGRRVELARQALDACPDCADAYVLLAEHARGRKEALGLYEQGVAAGERALGPGAFREAAGRFWSIPEARPYLRARLGLAQSLWSAGRRDEAIGHLQDMLRLNRKDDQGVRYTLAGFLLFLDRDDDLAALLQQYPDEDSAAWAYTGALLAFRQKGDTIEARRSLKAAKKANRHVPAYLTGQHTPPARPPADYRPGDESEAWDYVGNFLAGWKSTPGAVAWVRAHDEKTRRRKAQAPQARGPLGVAKKWLGERLPQEQDVWQADFRQTPNWVRVAGEPLRPWMVLVTSRSSDLALAHQVVEESPSAALLWDTLVRAMQHPAAGSPRRPAELQVRADDRWDALRAHVEEVGVTLSVAESLDQAEAVFEAMSEHVGGKAGPGLLDTPGVTAGQVAGFYEAAASFFRQAPWKKVGHEAAIKVECARFEGGPWYAVLTGQSGLTSGLALYDDLGTLRGLWQGGADEENARQAVGTSVTFGEEWDVPVADLEAARRHGWEVARPDAYPEVTRKERGLSCRPPLAWELGLMEVCLRAVPGFVSRRQQGDPAREEVTVPAACGSLKLVLSWVAEDEA